MLSLIDFGILAFHHFMGAGHAVYHTGFHIAVQRYLIGEFRAVSKTSVLCILSKKIHLATVSLSGLLPAVMPHTPGYSGNLCLGHDYV